MNSAGDAAPQVLVKSVFITGASGFVGSAFARCFADNGMRVRAGVRPSGAAAPAPDIEMVEIGDLERRQDWGRALEGVDAVVHAAGLAHQKRSLSDAEILRVNAEATLELAEAAKRAGARRFLFISSVRALAGPWSDTPISDDSQPAPTDVYGRSKLAGEEAALAHGPGAAVLRLAPVCGAGARGYFRLMARIAATPAPLPVSSLRGRRSFVTDRNAADAARWILENDATFGERYLVAEAEPATAAQFIAKLREARGAPARVFGAPRLAIEVAKQLPGVGAMIERLDRDLVVRCPSLHAVGWRPVEAAEEGLRRMMLGVK
ncbi:MAG: NAD-dependent epimerase/dehydratase family protein [Beijerinckiaceae bacterium]